MSLDKFKAAISSLILIALVIAALALALDGFQDGIENENPCGTSGYSFNATSGACDNTTHQLTKDMNYQWNITNEGLEGISNSSSYLSTIGTLLGVAALIAVVIMAFYFVRR